MKNIIYKILIIILCFFSFNFVKATQINDTYIQYEKLTDEEKKEIDLIPNEYVNYYEIKPNTILKQKNRGIYNLYSSLPTSYNLTNVNNKRLVPEVKNQGSLGLCWAFSTNNILESYQLKKGKSYNLSENQPGYVASYLKDISTIGSANSLGNAIKYWFEGYSPISEDLFGSYFTTYKDKEYKEYLDNNNVLFDITDVIVYPMLKMNYIKENYSVSNIEYIVNEYNNMLKEHIINYGALATGIYWDFYDENTNLIYNDGKTLYENYASSGHAITIIGWDDNYEGVTIKGTKLNGAWLAMNSWGEDIQYFYISYYDDNVTESVVGIKEIQDKKWNNVYTNYDVYKTNQTKITYEFSKEDKLETIDSLKIFYLYNDDNINVTISDGINEYKTITDPSITFGVKTYKFDNLKFDSEKIYVTLETTAPNEYLSLALYTKDEQTEKSLSIIDKKTSTIENIQLTYDIYTKNIETGTKLKINIYDDNNKNINSLFQISNSMIINDYSNINLILLGDIKYTKYIKIEAIADNIIDNVYLYNKNQGTENDPIIIRKPSEMKELEQQNKYFKLANDIDMLYDTTALYGEFYNESNGWKPIEFKGYLDGNGYEISNLNTKQGSLFETINNSNIKNIKLNNFKITDTSSSSSFTSAIAKTMTSSNISNVYINNLDINANKSSSGAVVGNITDGTIKDIHIKDSNINAKYYSGLVTASVLNPSNEINIQNIFINNSQASSNISALLIGKIDYVAEESQLNKTNIKYNIIANDDKTLPLIGQTYTKITNNNEELINYDIYEKYVILENNYIKNNEEIFQKETFNDYDLSSTWSYNKNTSAYLTLFKSDFIKDNVLEFKTYSIEDDIISKINVHTTVDNFENNIKDKTNILYKIYSKDNIELNSNDYLTTGSYISIKNEDIVKKYYISVKGDTNADGEISVFDIVKINNHIIDDNKRLEGIYNTAADYNLDGEISIFDIVKINNEIIGGN